MKNMRIIANGSLLVLSLVAFSGCDMFKKKSGGDAAAPKTVAGSSTLSLCSIDGKTVISEADFIATINQVLEANPYFRGASADSLPSAVRKKIFEESVKKALIVTQADKNNVENDPEFKKAYEETSKLVKESLKVQFFQKGILDGIKISDAEVEKHFNENKERYVKAAGGVLVAGARFDSDADASAFLQKAKANADNFEKLAKADKQANFKDFGRVSESSRGFGMDMTPKPIKEAALAMNKFPGVAKAKVGKEYWVIKAFDKKDAQYFDLKEIKPQLEMMLKNNLFKDELDKKLKALEDQHKVVRNEDYFKEKEEVKEKEGDDAGKEANAGAPSVTTA